MADSATRTYKMRVGLSDAPLQLKLGMTAVVTAVIPGEKAVGSLPLAAIYQTGDTPSVWVVNDGVVNLRPVEIGMFGDNQVQVTEGLKEGDIVVIAGVHKLKEGQKVRLALSESIGRTF
jgi:RND family efflux transporter MFP subunit